MDQGQKNQIVVSLINLKAMDLVSAVIVVLVRHLKSLGASVLEEVQVDQTSI